MYLKVIGTEVKCGVFTDPNTKRDINYNNIYLHCIKDNNYLSDDKKSFGFGSVPVSVKIKNSVDKVTSVFGAALSSDDLEGMIGSYVNVFYDDKKQVDAVLPADPPKSDSSKKKEAS